jgi:hypothetical protein
MGTEEELRLPPGFRLDRSDPDVWALRRPEGGWLPTSASEALPRRP